MKLIVLPYCVISLILLRCTKAERSYLITEYNGRIILQGRVGNGDSSLPAGLSKRLSKGYIQNTLDFVRTLTAFITIQAVACPEYRRAIINRFMIDED